QLNVGLALHRAQHVLDPAQFGREAAFRRIDHLALGAGQAQQLLVTGAKHLRHRAALQIDAGAMDGGEVLGFPKQRYKSLGLLARLLNLPELVDNDAPTADGKGNQNPEYRLYYRTCAHQELENSRGTQRTRSLWHMKN